MKLNILRQSDFSREYKIISIKTFKLEQLIEEQIYDWLKQY